ncbi:hypothetical protein [Leisingera sp. JC1]|uniref:hypothetical protein n=1 Tax=Leisingera sp. JC1 TaxID=1855282 RepID=UPI0011306A5F|nr:hypothetical protein [Leisingera sp. JC1]
MTAPIACILSLVATEGHSQTVGDLLNGCEDVLKPAGARNSELYSDGVMCLGLAAGVSQVMWFNCSSRREGSVPHGSLVAAMPPSRTAALQAFVNWGRANPGMWDFEAELGFIEALPMNFPCKEKQQSAAEG